MLGHDDELDQNKLEKTFSMNMSKQQAQDDFGLLPQDIKKAVSNQTISYIGKFEDDNK